MSEQTSLTTTELLGAATETLESNGYHKVESSIVTAGASRFFEDPYSIVEVVIYETWSDLSSRWTDAQGVLVELISKYLSSSEPKAWDGYLVLLTQGGLPSDCSQQASQIRSNTSRVRKLLATGEDLKTIGDLQRVLLPLLPVSGESIAVETYDRTFEGLPDIVAEAGASREAVLALIDAYAHNKPMMEELHEWYSKQ